VGRYVTFKEVARMVGQVVGRDVKDSIVTYDPSKFKEVIPKGWFPFRNTHFNVSPEKAKRVLGWSPAHDLKADLEEYYRWGEWWERGLACRLC
jgi:nucleoside-diphosphate-sugar epimerase